ncbi:hypothetical protein HDIA_3023 [Hartmannibacter diazotrophicus]|uniref:Uncharacterized protein n=1 Tax=Hartmannibacter diazotrophicus TaxID=1482074 RepID=A0A2C9D8A8_9HYPH|nr:hypothetical protein [Hartmannibacter diazotrophicus]SON56564.1 hypothetical protein HDIA_3023 [Hartmannibacter diazotrophicus]
MQDGLNETTGEAKKVRRLSDAVRRVRIAEADRVDAFADLFEAERARLMLLAEELDGVFGEVPLDDGYFVLKIMPGTPPRLWLDPTTHVVIGRDRRSYRLLKDTRLGRTTLHETADMDDIADAVTNYLAERLVEREKLLEVDYVQKRLVPMGGLDESTVAASEAKPAGRNMLWGLLLLVLGAALGIAALMAFAWFRIPA